MWRAAKNLIGFLIIAQLVLGATWLGLMLTFSLLAKAA